MSEWNKASGNWSWEERDVSKWGSERLRELICQYRCSDCPSFCFLCDLCSGEATVLFLHGKRRVGYEFEDLKFKFELNDSGKTIKGSVHLPYVCDDVADKKWEIRISTENARRSAEVQGLVRRAVCEIIDVFIEDLRNKQL